MKSQASQAHLLTLEDAAKVLGGVSSWTLRKHVGEGTIECVHIGRRVFLHSAEVARISRQGLPSLTLVKKKAKRGFAQLV